MTKQPPAYHGYLAQEWRYPSLLRRSSCFVKKDTTLLRNLSRGFDSHSYWTSSQMSGLKASNISSLDLGGLFRSILALIDVSNGTNGAGLPAILYPFYSQAPRRVLSWRSSIFNLGGVVLSVHVQTFISLMPPRLRLTLVRDAGRKTEKNF